MFYKKTQNFKNTIYFIILLREFRSVRHEHQRCVAETIVVRKLVIAELII